MSKQISYFTDYHSGENCITNYCGLMMKMVYDESHVKFENLINDLLASLDVSIEVGAIFSQQVKKINSIPDLCIRQKSFNIFFENKLYDWFKNNQLMEHLNALGNADVTLLVLLCNDFKIDTLDEVKRQNESLDDKKYIVCVTYEDFVDVLSRYCVSDFLSVQFEEFSTFLDGQNLLSTWKDTLDVVNCADSIAQIKEGVYLSPDTKGPYSHKRAKFFGAYKDKAVKYISHIDAVVSVVSNDDSRVKWNNTDTADKDLIDTAKNFVQQYCASWDLSTPIQVFLLRDTIEVNFIKSTKGGLFGSKLYFDGIAKGCENTSDLKEKIDGKSWSDFGKR